MIPCALYVASGGLDVRAVGRAAGRTTEAERGRETWWVSLGVHDDGGIDASWASLAAVETSRLLEFISKRCPDPRCAWCIPLGVLYEGANPDTCTLL